jgi:hypothetical protein
MSELVRQQTILYHADSRSIPARVVSLCQAHIRPIVRGKARYNVQFGAKISISVTGEGFTFLDRLSYDSYNEGEGLKAQAIAYRTLSESDLCWPDLPDKIKPCILSASRNPLERPPSGTAEERS